ncbi:MAG: CYTH domain-containing protein [Sphingomonadaceae bacterium]
MAIEIERKFLVVNDGWRAGTIASKAIRQGYLARGHPASVRIRVTDGVAAMLTIKSALAGGGRQEFEYPVSLADADALLALAEGDLIEKRRHIVPDSQGGLNWEVDVFGGRLSGLVLAEIELDRIDRPLVLPGWIGREVTEDPRYYNAQLSRAETVPGEVASVETTDLAQKKD